jgi:hypothetical protein
MPTTEDVPFRIFLDGKFIFSVYAQDAEQAVANVKFVLKERAEGVAIVACPANSASD